MSITWYLISRNHDGSISYLNSGTYRQMKKLEKHHFHYVTSIDNESEYKERYSC